MKMKDFKNAVRNIEDDLILLELLKNWLLFFYDKNAHEFISEVELNNNYVLTAIQQSIIKGWLENDK